MGVVTSGVVHAHWAGVDTKAVLGAELAAEASSLMASACRFAPITTLSKNAVAKNSAIALRSSEMCAKLVPFRIWPSAPDIEFMGKGLAGRQSSPSVLVMGMLFLS